MPKLSQWHHRQGFYGLLQRFSGRLSVFSDRVLPGSNLSALLDFAAKIIKFMAWLLPVAYEPFDVFCVYLVYQKQIQWQRILRLQ